MVDIWPKFHPYSRKTVAVAEQNMARVPDMATVAPSLEKEVN